MAGYQDFAVARATLCRALAARRADRLGRVIRGPAFDDGAMIGDDDDPATPPLVFHLIYRDAKGDLSGRCFTLRNARNEIADIRLTGLCHLRGALRTFMASRIVEVTELATGEVNEDPLEYFRRHPLLRGGADALAALSLETMALQECRDEVIVLTVLAAADGDVAEAECDEIVRHVMDRCPDEGLSEVEVRRRVGLFVPDEQAFQHALERIAAGAGEPKALLRAMRRLVDADGRLDPEEVAFVVEIEAELAAAGRI